MSPLLFVTTKFLVRSFGEEFVLYSPESGDTHLVDAFSAYIIKNLDTEPVTMETLKSRLREETDLPADLEKLEEQLERLQLSGLISICHS